MSTGQAVSRLFDLLGLSEEDVISIGGISTEEEGSDPSRLRVNQLIRIAVTQPDETDAIILTMNLSTTAIYVLGAIFQLYCDGEQEMKRLAVLFLHKWATGHKDHFTLPMKKACTAFHGMIKSSDPENVGESTEVETALSRRQSQAICRAPQMELPDGDPKNWTLLKVPPEELGRQITIYQAHMFHAITTASLGDPGHGSALKLLIKQGDTLASYVAMFVIGPAKLSERADVFRMWVTVANFFIEHSNFIGAFSIHAGLTHPTIVEMKATVAKALKKKKKDDDVSGAFERLCELCSPVDDYANYVAKVGGAPPRCLPNLKIMEADLARFMPLVIDGLVDLVKSKEAAVVIAKFNRFNKSISVYPFSPHEKIQDMIAGLTEIRECEKYIMSLAHGKK